MKRNKWTNIFQKANKSNVPKCQKISSCQKDVKCQKIKHLDYGGGSQKFDIMRFTDIEIKFYTTYDGH